MLAQARIRGEPLPLGLRRVERPDRRAQRFHHRADGVRMPPYGILVGCGVGLWRLLFVVGDLVGCGVGLWRLLFVVGDLVGRGVGLWRLLFVVGDLVGRGVGLWRLLFVVGDLVGRGVRLWRLLFVVGGLVGRAERLPRQLLVVRDYRGPRLGCRSAMPGPRGATQPVEAETGGEHRDHGDEHGCGHGADSAVRHRQERAAGSCPSSGRNPARPAYCRESRVPVGFWHPERPRRGIREDRRCAGFRPVGEPRPVDSPDRWTRRVRTE
ncbi:hypothetical protein [Nocardia beijingensis]|uniref:hypothetical protein n=1 Tax=Nocardia beijingensis TaxID=95162 RepID=UPI000AAA8C0A